ncbi:1,3-beta-galactosyl-N-acetylhexosamine phosphorylase [candidate division KSB1 bacterium]|nr:1,3-beta-galactosyl-N-acetylhexosamine phosphorylase [candidate division KSB1 bacterium]
MIDKVKLTGHFTLPAQKGMDEEVKMLIEKWGVDAIRDSDGTALSPEILSMGPDIYSTICLIRVDQEWAKAHPDQCQQKFLMSFPITAEQDGELIIPIQKGYSREQFRIDAIHDPKKYWEVIDRTTGGVVPVDQWEFDEKHEDVIIQTAKKRHVYTVNFLVFQIWETTSMYNYITNNWSGEHQMGVDPHQPETGVHLLDYLDGWLKDHPQTDYVRFTSMMYQFPLIKGENRETLYLDWSGYLDAMSALALDQFEQKFGYRLRSEDIVDQGYYCSTDRVPKKPYQDWMTFTQEFVRDYTKQCVNKVHDAGKKAILFFCDHWIGTEPYLDGFDELGFDGIVGPCLSGVELRRISDVPGEMIKEVRLYPYFFEVNLQDEPVFKGNGVPVKECKKWWKGVRRALLRNCVDRIGFGGYLDLAIKYPDFLEYVGVLANEFRTVLDRTKKTKPYVISKKVAVLDCWGKARSWMHNDNWPKGHVPEFLSGFGADVVFINFDDIRQNGIPDDIGVIVNWGSADSAWSGGLHWKGPIILESIRDWVAHGGGFIGVDAPTAHEYQGRYFQLSNVLGVEKEIGHRAAWSKNICPSVETKHFILEDVTDKIDLNVAASSVHINSPDSELLAGAPDAVHLSTHSYGKGRAVYFSDYLLSAQNMRLLHRAILWASNLENELHKWFTSNIHTDCAFYPEVEEFIVMNNYEQDKETTIYSGDGKSSNISLGPMEMKWFKLTELNEILK